MGTQHRVGTTTIAMQFTVYLKSIGANVSYVEANDSWHLRLIAENYRMQEIEDGYRYKGIAFESINLINKVFFDFIVYDLGIFRNRMVKGILNSNIRVICTGDEPHEIPFLRL